MAARLKYVDTCARGPARARSFLNPPSLRTQVPSVVYASYHRHFASWGYAVVTYGHATVIDLIPDSVEVNFSPPVLAWADAQAQKAGTALNLTGGIGVTGHSKGGQLAALQWCTQAAGMPPVTAAALISPVGHTL
jgi:dienelactone hydrolase